jgi:protein phosphatase
LKGKVEIVGLTDTGRVREHNEDCIAANVDAGLAVLADGMGGLKAGEVASAMAVEIVSSEILKALPGVEPGAADEATGYAQESMIVGAAIDKANATIHQVAQTQPQCAGMGTTLVTLLFYDNRLTIAHVGDSRLYRYRHGEFEQVTSDHSLIQELIDRGYYTREQARKSANRNIVTRALGIAPGVEYDIQEEVAVPGDIFLLCSDGLSDMVEENDIRDLIARHERDLPTLARRLVERANEGGGRDNISVMLARVQRPYPFRSNWLSRLISWFD